MPDISHLRSVAKQRQRAVGKKISRIRNQVGAELKGTKYDPRRPASDISKMDSRSLQRYINKLNNFQRRSVQFVQGAENKPVKRSMWQTYVNLQTVVNKRASEFNKAFDPITDINNKPGSGNTIGAKRNRLSKTSDQWMRGEANRPFRVSEMDSTTIRSEEGLAKLIKLARKQSSPRYLKRQIKEYRNRIDKALDKMAGSEGMQDDFNKLTDFEFMAIWDNPGMLDTFFSKYESMQKQTAETIDGDDDFDEFGHLERVDDNGNVIAESTGIFKWATEIEPPDNSPI